jgi:hypothetical protein
MYAPHGVFGDNFGASGVMTGSSGANTSSAFVPAITMVPQYREKGRVEQSLFPSNNLKDRVTDEFLTEMAREAREEREKAEAERLRYEEATRRRFLKEKWQKIVNGLNRNYKGLELNMFEASGLVSNWSESVHPSIVAEIKRCMAIPSELLRTKLARDCHQCSKKLYEGHDHGVAVRHPRDPRFDFDGHFPEDHVNLEGFEERSKEEIAAQPKTQVLRSPFAVPFAYDVRG